MSGEKHPKLENVDLDTSYILGVIYDDVSLTLEMDFHLLEGHPRFEQTDAEEGCYRKGFIRFSDMEDLRLKKTKAPMARARSECDRERHARRRIFSHAGRLGRNRAHRQLDPDSDRLTGIN